MNLKKILMLLLVIASVLSFTSCGKNPDSHADSFIDNNGDGYCDAIVDEEFKTKCGRAQAPCIDEHGAMSGAGYCLDCHFLHPDYSEFKVVHKICADDLHGDGFCDVCGQPTPNSSTRQDLAIKWNLFYHGFIAKEGYKEVLKGLLVTLEVAVFGLIIGIVLGTAIALVGVMPKTNWIAKSLNVICNIYVGFFRGTPMVVQLLIGYFVLLPALGIAADGVIVAIIIFGMNSGAYVSEIMRAGINSVDPGQLEAGRAVGLPFWTAMLKIVIPQSIKNILPTLGNEFIVLVKETSVVSFIAVVDITKAFKSIADANYEYLIPYIMLALVYLVLVLIITLCIKLMERRLKRNERNAK